ncbi:Acb2/Tad1 domain-containing protein [Agathobaculum desmolans]|uniref:Acb2/Tad1 domain-containing protein n=1 Tax=Agathobaculum desmolans TaxID=39484 RepID=UPI0004E1A185|nr:hypothetical protein [Agathobaculum desmolans]
MKSLVDKMFSQHTMTDDEKENCDRIRTEAKRLAQMITDICPISPERSVALRRLRETVSWAEAAIEFASVPQYDSAMQVESNEA